jgi:23S rRNA (guanine745-N1)-methyltransferase
MGPSAHHIEPAVLAERVAGLPESVRVTAAVVVQTFRRRPAGRA